jgi:two-component sensor histidine kinase/tetratricopeptide (TPR) repeat protein
MLKKNLNILLVVCVQAFSFSHNKDSLLQITNSTLNDSIKINAYHLLGNEALMSKKKDALLYFSKAEKLALALKNNYLLGQTYYYKALFYVEKLKNYSLGLINIDKSIEYLSNTKYYKELMLAYQFKGRNIYEALNMDKEAIEAIRKSVLAAKSINSESHAFQLYVLGWFETNNNMPDSAIKHLNNCYSIEINLPKIDYKFVVELLIWTGNAYRVKKDYRTALNYQFRAVSLSDSIRYGWGKFSSYRYIAYNYYDNLHNNDSAIYYLKPAEDYYIRTKDPVLAHYVGTDMIRYFLKTNRLNDADGYVKQLTDTTLMKLISNDYNKIRFYKILFDYYKAKGNYKQAMNSLYQYSILKDSADAIKQRANLGEQSLKHELQLMQEQQKVEQQKKDFILQRKLIEQRFFSYIMLAIIFVILVLLVIAYAVIRQKKKTNQKISAQKIEIEMNLEEKEVLLREIHHRVKNNLQIISGLMVHQLSGTTDEIMRANCITIKNKINAIGLIHENFYQSKNLAYIDMHLYISRLIKNILTLSNIKDVKTHVIIKNVVFDIDTATPLGLIINELITNSIKHVFNDNSAGTKEIKIELTEISAGCYELVYSDSGAGFHPTNTKKGLGLNLIDLLTNQLNGKNRMEYSDTWKMIIDFENTAKRKEKD